MDFLGTWKLKEMLWVAKGKFRKVSDAEIAAMEPSEENKELRRMLAAEFIVSESSLDVFYRPPRGRGGACRKEGLGADR